MIMILYKGQRIRFRGIDGTFRAAKLASELGADVHANVVTLRRNIELRPVRFTFASLKAELSGALEFGANGRSDACRQ